jgi:hypothetical protein
MLGVAVLIAVPCEVHGRKLYKRSSVPLSRGKVYSPLI